MNELHKRLLEMLSTAPPEGVDPHRVLGATIGYMKAAGNPTSQELAHKLDVCLNEYLTSQGSPRKPKILQ